MTDLNGAQRIPAITAYDRDEIFYFIDKDGLPDQRVTDTHPSIGLYVVRASVLMTDEMPAVVCCEWLNKMVYDREGVEDRFKVINYKSSKQTFVVVRKLMAGDLVRAIDEYVEVKQR